MNHTNNPTAVQSQKWILQAMLELMEFKEYDTISVSEICARAQLDRRTFYRNFDSKKDVLDQHLDQLGREYMEGVSVVNELDREAAVLCFFNFWKEHLQFIRNIQACGLSDYVFRIFTEFVRSKRALLADTETVDVLTDYIYAYRIGGFWNTMLVWAANGADILSEDVASVILGELKSR